MSFRDTRSDGFDTDFQPVNMTGQALHNRSGFAH